VLKLAIHRDNRELFERQGHPEHLFGREIGDLEDENVFRLDT
jgi:hypothetical protein